MLRESSGDALVAGSVIGALAALVQAASALAFEATWRRGRRLHLLRRGRRSYDSRASFAFWFPNSVWEPVLGPETPFHSYCVIKVRQLDVCIATGT